MSEISMHPETALVPYVKNELAPAEHARVTAHLEGCERCRVALADVRAVLGALTPAPVPTEPHWGRYRAEVRARLAERRRGPRRWPMPIALSAGLAAVLVLLMLRPAPVEKPATNLTQIEETTLGARLDMLRHYDVVTRLDMLDAMDEIRQLDVVPVGGR